MKIRTLLRKGEEHKIFCQDFIFQKSIDQWTIAAIFDGCSNRDNEEMSNESQFVSNLSAKILNIIIPRLINYKRFDPSIFAYDISKTYFKLLLHFKEELALTEDELLTTMILLVYNNENKKGRIIAFGDGYIRIDGKVMDIENGKVTPENPEGGVYYPIQYIEDIFGEDTEYSDRKFEDFIATHPDQWFFHDPKDIIIASDGITSWKNIKNKNPNISSPEEFITTDKNFQELPLMLTRKYNQLVYDGWFTVDDISIVRLIEGDEIINKESIKEINQVPASL